MLNARKVIKYPLALLMSPIINHNLSGYGAVVLYLRKKRAQDNRTNQKLMLEN